MTSKLKKMGANQSKPRIFFIPKPLTDYQLFQTTCQYSQEILKDYKNALNNFNKIIAQLNERYTVMLEAIKNPVLSSKDRESLKNSVTALLNQKAKLLRIHANLLKSCAYEASNINASCAYDLSIARPDRMVYRANSYFISGRSEAIDLRANRMEKLNNKLITENNVLVAQHSVLDAQYSAIWEKYNLVL